MWIDLDLVGIPVLWICENRSVVAGIVHSKKGRQLSPEDVYGALRGRAAWSLPLSMRPRTESTAKTGARRCEFWGGGDV